MPAARAYSLQLLGTLALLMALTAAFNGVLDPYGIYHVVDRPGFNADKPGQKGHDRLVKAYAIAALAPDALLMGSSRVQYGLNPCDASLAAVAQRPYNAALLGSNIYLALRYLQHAQAQGAVRTAVLGLDPLMFDSINADAARDFSETRLAVDAHNVPQAWGALTDVPATLLSWDTLRLSFRTWRKQGHIVSDLLTDGQRSPKALARLYDDGRSTAERFLSVDRTYAHDYAHAAWPVVSADADAPLPPSLQALADLIAFARDEHIALHLYFTPEHAHLHQVAAAGGHAGAIEALKREVAQQVFTSQSRAPKDAPLTLWAMDALTPYTTEAVPQDAGEHGALAWFWEATHARDSLGRLILERMLVPAPGAQAQAVGVALSPQNLDGHFANQAQNLAAWRAAHPQEVQQIADLVAAAGAL